MSFSKFFMKVLRNFNMEYLKIQKYYEYIFYLKNRVNLCYFIKYVCLEYYVIF